MAAAARKQPAELADRVATAIAEPTTSGELVDLLAEAQRALADVVARHKREEEAILDPLTRSEAAQAARDALERLSLDRRRWEAAVTRLEERQKAVREEERQRERQKVLDEVVALRDEAAALVREKYPKLSQELAEILRAVSRAHEVARVAEQMHGIRVQPVDEVVRGVRSDGVVIGRGSHEMVPLLLSARLPKLQPDVHQPYVWPQRAG